jgi:hypothetical protein
MKFCYLKAINMAVSNDKKGTKTDLTPIYLRIDEMVLEKNQKSIFSQGMHIFQNFLS